MTRRVSAFTIVEFTIAVAIAALLSGLAITRYNGFIRDQKFFSSGQAMASCIQKANQTARVGSAGTVPRFVRATLSTTGTNMTCVAESLGASAGQTQLTASLVATGIPAEVGTPVTIEAMQFYTGVLGTTGPIRIVFGGLESGLPLALGRGTTLIRQPDDSVATSYVPRNKGFSLTESVNVIKLQSTDNLAICGIITMTNLGSPVRFQPVKSCS